MAAERGAARHQRAVGALDGDRDGGRPSHAKVVQSVQLSGFLGLDTESGILAVPFRVKGDPSPCVCVCVCVYVCVRVLSVLWLTFVSRVVLS